jgi:putative FmdB family regulatory protein
MPIHEYICQNCNLRFDYLVRALKESIACPRCKHKDLKRLISTFAFSSKDNQGNITSSSSGCSGCTSQNCSTCGR